MKKVKVDKYKLIGIIKGNRDKHTKEYDEACEEYVTAALKLLEDTAATIRQDNAVVPLHFNLPVPQDHQSDYDNALKLLDMRCDDDITLEGSDVQRLLLDEWSWQGDLDHVKTVYAATMRG